VAIKSLIGAKRRANGNRLVPRGALAVSLEGKPPQSDNSVHHREQGLMAEWHSSGNSAGHRGLGTLIEKNAQTERRNQTEDEAAIGDEQR
jgi:hypothetical protein